MTFELVAALLTTAAINCHAQKSHKTEASGEKRGEKLQESHSHSRNLSRSLCLRPDEPPWGIQLEFTGSFPPSLNLGLKFHGLQVCISTVILR